MNRQDEWPTSVGELYDLAYQMDSVSLMALLDALRGRLGHGQLVDACDLLVEVLTQVRRAGFEAGRREGLEQGRATTAGVAS